MPKVTVFSQVYNTAAYLPQCVESVLNQTFQDFEFLIVDNGCTDGSQDILREYAAKDARIRLIRFEENKVAPRALEAAAEYGTGTYATNLDSDDWWELDYLEKLLAFGDKNRLDIACTGTMMHIADTGKQSLRKVDQSFILTREMFAKALPWYHVFFRPIWGKLIRMDCLRASLSGPVPKVVYGADTCYCFLFLQHAGSIGIEHSILHHYRIHKSSASYVYDPRRFESDVYLYNDAIDFLSSFGPVSTQNRNFLQCVYFNAVTDTTDVIQNSTLSPADKLREYRTIASHPITLAAYRECFDESAVRSKMNLIVRALEAGAALGKQDDNDLRAVMQMLLPRCGYAVTAANAGLFLKEQTLLQALLHNNTDVVLGDLLERLKDNQGIKQYSIPETIRALAVDNPLLCQIDDAVFLRKYGDIYQKVWNGDRLAALDDMAGLLIEGSVDDGRETFLTLFVSLAAALEQPSAFVFGKLQMAKLYLRQNRLPESRAVVAELEEMGLEDNEELEELRRCLEEQ